MFRIKSNISLTSCRARYLLLLADLQPFFSPHFEFPSRDFTLPGKLSVKIYEQKSPFDQRLPSHGPAIWGRSFRRL